MQDNYWASSDIKEIAGKIEMKFSDYKKWLETTGYGNRIKTCYQRYYSLDGKGSLKVVRDEDDIARIEVNHYKSLIKRIHIMVTENKLAFIPKARNSDAKSQMKSDIGRGVCDYYGDEKDMNGVLSQAVLGSLVMLEQYIHCPWDQAAGFELAASDDQKITTGDQLFEIFSAFDVARNTASEESTWHIVRKKCNKYDLAVLYPEFGDEIRSSIVERDIYDLNFQRITNDSVYVDDEDYTYKYILYHDRTPSMPAGRLVEICAGHVLRDGSLQYQKAPIVRLQAGSVLETSFADSPAVDLIGIQQAMNALWSGAVTNGVNNAIQLIYAADPNLSTRKLESGQTLVSSASPPSALNLSGSNAETMKLIEMLMQHEQLISGVSDVARGNPSANLKSGASIAVVLAQAIQYVSVIQKNYAKAAGDVGSILIANLQKFGPEEMIGYIVGSSRKGQVRNFKKADLLDIERVSVDLGNPIMQTLGGRFDIAQGWAQMGIMKDPKQIEAFMRTGELDQITEDDFSDMILIREENEAIKKGENPPVMMLDNHSEHILGHKRIFSALDVRAEPNIVSAGLAHIQSHIDMMRQVPPDLASVISGQGLPPPVEPQMGGQPAKPEAPTVNGVALPSLPVGAPASAQANFNQNNQSLQNGGMQ